MGVNYEVIIFLTGWLTASPGRYAVPAAAHQTLQNRASSIEAYSDYKLTIETNFQPDKWLAYEILDIWYNINILFSTILYSKNIFWHNCLSFFDLMISLLVYRDYQILTIQYYINIVLMIQYLNSVSNDNDHLPGI